MRTRDRFGIAALIGIAFALNVALARSMSLTQLKARDLEQQITQAQVEALEGRISELEKRVPSMPHHMLADASIGDYPWRPQSEPDNAPRKDDEKK
jgi:hypothetical protein